MYDGKFFLYMRLSGVSIQDGREYYWNLRKRRGVDMFEV
jgi:hypothetical protein